MKYNKFLILLLIFQTTYILSDISVQQAAQAVIHRDLATLSQYAQQGGDFTAQVPEYNNYNLLELALINIFFTNVLEYHESIIENQTHLLELS
ncbi:MAG: hypothetical protein ACXWL2_02200 [Candidatus Chromulinivorax sp.]